MALPYRRRTASIAGMGHVLIPGTPAATICFVLCMTQAVVFCTHQRAHPFYHRRAQCQQIWQLHSGDDKLPRTLFLAVLPPWYPHRHLQQGAQRRR